MQLVLVDARSLHYYFLDKYESYVNYIALMTKLLEKYDQVNAIAFVVVRRGEEGDEDSERQEKGFLRIFSNAGFSQKVYRLAKTEKFNPIGVGIVHEVHQNAGKPITVITADRGIELIKGELDVEFWGPFGESIDECRIKPSNVTNRVVVSSDSSG